MGKNRPNANREKVDHRKGKQVRGGGRDNDDVVPQELIDKAAVLGCQVWEIEEYEARAAMDEVDSDEEVDSDLSEESQAALKASNAKAKKAAANKEMPPISSDEEGEAEEEKKAAPKGEDEEDESSDDDAELERLYGMGKNNNKNVKVGAEPEEEEEEESDEEGRQPEKVDLNDFLNAAPEEEKKQSKPKPDAAPKERILSED